MAYTYLIGWTQYNKWYYGLRYAKGCKTTDLWSTYFTSSKYVKQFRKQFGEPDVIQIRKTFQSKESAILWENKVLTKLKVIKSHKWLNQTNNKAIDNSLYKPSEEQKIKTSERISLGLTGKKMTDQAKENQSKGKMGLVWWNNGVIEKKSKEAPDSTFIRGRIYSPSEELRKNIGLKSLGNKHNIGRKQTQESNLKRSETLKNKIVSQETRNKISDKHKGRKMNWFTNGHTETFNSVCPDGYVSGRLKRPSPFPSPPQRH
jgi:hypothetical protein